MKTRLRLRSAAALLLLFSSGIAAADTLASVEPIASASVVDIAALEAEDLEVRAAFAERFLQCGVVDAALKLLDDAHVTTTIDAWNTAIEVAAGGFAGTTNPTYTISARGRRAASQDDIQALSDSLGFVMSQDSVFLLDEDTTTSLDFPASYAVLRFRRAPALEDSAALFETVGRIDADLFATDTSGYTQFGRSYVTLQSDVPADEFIDGYVQAAEDSGVEYTPVVAGVPSLFQGSAAFPGNDWVAHPHGEEYLDRLPRRIHEELRHLRHVHLRFTRQVLARLERGDDDRRELLRFIRHLECR